MREDSEREVSSMERERGREGGKGGTEEGREGRVEGRERDLQTYHRGRAFAELIQTLHDNLTMQLILNAHVLQRERECRFAKYTYICTRFDHVNS